MDISYAVLQIRARKAFYTIIPFFSAHILCGTDRFQIFGWIRERSPGISLEMYQIYQRKILFVKSLKIAGLFDALNIGK